MNQIHKGIRVANGIIDIMIVSIISSILVIVLEVIGDPRLMFSLVCVAYYFILEVSLGRTVGKLITGTKVVNMNNEKPGFWRILLRSVLRLYPFDSASYLFGNEQGAHDLLSRTRLVKCDTN
ncbi:RDD family protein [Labilibacter sediminis]|nr:RDD family protein [Labilibacter sediminis]